MPPGIPDVEEPLLEAIGEEIPHPETGEPLGGDVRLNHATATLAATIIGRACIHSLVTHPPKLMAIIQCSSSSRQKLLMQLPALATATAFHFHFLYLISFLLLFQTTTGAGIMALPRAFATLGLLVGMSLLAIVFGLAFFSLFSLIQAAKSSKCWTYDQLAHHLLGDFGSRALSTAIIVNNSGSMIIYLIIIGDVLCGVAPDYSGLITNLFNIHDPAAVFWVSRPFVMAVLCAVCLAPLVSLRNLSLLAPMSTAAVGVAGLFVSSVVGLAVTAAFQGQLGDFRWLPTEEMLGDSPSKIIINLLAVLPVVSFEFFLVFFSTL